MTPDINDFKAQLNANTHQEHKEQIDLLQRLVDVTEAGADAATVKACLDQIIDYTDVHFMSEEVLMRIKGYDDYNEHQQDHLDMLDELRDMARAPQGGPDKPMAAQARHMLALAKQHIASRDKRLAEHMRQEL